MKKAGTFFVFRDAPAVDNNQADILLNLNHTELKFLYERILQLPKQVRSPTPAGTCSRCIVGKNTRAQSSGRFRPFPFVKVVHSLAFIACSLRYKLQFLYILSHILLPHKWPLSHRQVCYHRLNVPLPYEPCLALIGKGNLNHLRQLLLCDFDGNQVKKWLLPWQLTA